MAYVLKTDVATKMAILYVINNFKEGITSEILTEVAVYACGINYFLLRQHLFRLEEDEFITSFSSENGEMFIINEKGEQALEFFVKKLPYRFREDVREYIGNLKPEYLPANKFICDYMPANDLEYKVQIEYREKGEPVLKLEFKAGDAENAKKTCRIINKNKDKVFCDIYKYIMELDAEQSNPDED